ncbi:MAG: IS21 family transposase, partial [Desulfobacteraceae bacterium]|nr:IS21 family transposase [Desulfobacteraceae bacterium]
MVHTTKHFGIAAAKSGMDEKTARKYVKLGKLPSEIKKEHHWRTRKDPFQDEWSKIQSMLELTP